MKTKIVVFICVLFTIILLLPRTVLADSPAKVVTKPFSNVSTCAAYCVEQTVKVCAVDYPTECTNIKATFCNTMVEKVCKLTFSYFNEK